MVKKIDMTLKPTLRAALEKLRDRGPLRTTRDDSGLHGTTAGALAARGWATKEEREDGKFFSITAEGLALLAESTVRPFESSADVS